MSDTLSDAAAGDDNALATEMKSIDNTTTAAAATTKTDLITSATHDDQLLPLEAKVKLDAEDGDILNQEAEGGEKEVVDGVASPPLIPAPNGHLLAGELEDSEDVTGEEATEEEKQVDDDIQEKDVAGNEEDEKVVKKVEDSVVTTVTEPESIETTDGIDLSTSVKSTDVQVDQKATTNEVSSMDDADVIVEENEEKVSGKKEQEKKDDSNFILSLEVKEKPQEEEEKEDIKMEVDGDENDDKVQDLSKEKEEENQNQKESIVKDEVNQNKERDQGLEDGIKMKVDDSEDDDDGVDKVEDLSQDHSQDDDSPEIKNEIDEDDDEDESRDNEQKLEILKIVESLESSSQSSEAMNCKMEEDEKVEELNNEDVSMGEDESKSEIESKSELESEVSKLETSQDTTIESSEESEEAKMPLSLAPERHKTTTSNVITEVVVGACDEVTLDLSSSLLNGNKDSSPSSSRQPLSEKNFSNGMPAKRTRSESSSGCSAEDLSLPAKRMAYTNGNHVEGQSVCSDDDEDELPMPPTPPAEDDEESREDRIRKQKLIRRLKQHLLNEEMKLLLLKKMRHSQLKENIVTSQTNHSISHANNLTNNATPSPTNLTHLNALRDLNLLANLQQSVSQSSGSQSALNFSNKSNNSLNLVNNNAAHSNTHSGALNLKNSYHPQSMLGHQAPMQAHMPKTSSKSNSLLNSPFSASGLGRSPYNHLNAPLPPPSMHGAPVSSKQRSSYDTHNINTAHRTSLNRSSIQTPPSTAHYQSSSSSSSKLNQLSSQQSAATAAQNEVNKELLLQRQQLASYKHLMRKHLEKVPHPKVMPAEMHFIPNPNNVEFIYYLGLENIVDYLTCNNQVHPPPEPFECVQCGTDFTPVWKWQDRSNPSKPSVICEKCVKKNVKKVIVDDFTKEMTGFSKTFDELEKQIATATAAAGNITPPSTAMSPSLAVASVPQPTPPVHQAHQSSTPTQRPSSNSNLSTHNNLYGSGSSNQTAIAAAAAAAANLSSLASLQQQVHSNSPISSLSAQMAAMAAMMLPQSGSSTTTNQMSTPPAAHSGSSRTQSSSSSSAAAAASSTSFNPFAALAASTSTNNSTAQTAALLAFLQQIQKVNPTQSLLMAQQLGLLSGAAASSSNNPMAQLLNFPNLLYSSLLAATLATPKPSGSSQSSSQLNATSSAAAAALQRQLMMEMLPNASGSSSNHGRGHSASLPHHNWKS